MRSCSRGAGCHIFNIGKGVSGELVAIFRHGTQGVLKLKDYRIKWIAYSYDEELLDNEKREM